MSLFIFPHVPKFCELENRSIIIIQFEEEKKRWKTPLRLRNLWDDNKVSSICAVDSQKQPREWGGGKPCEEMMAKWFPDLIKDINSQV